MLVNFEDDAELRNYIKECINWQKTVDTLAKEKVKSLIQ